MTRRPNTSRPGWRLSCNRAAFDLASAQSSACAAPGAPVAVSLARQLVTAVRSPCVRDACHLQRETDSTHHFHICSAARGARPIAVQCVCDTARQRRCTPPGHRGRDKRGRHHRAGKRQEFNAHHGSVNSSACRFLSKGPQIQRSQWHRASQPPPAVTIARRGVRFGRSNSGRAHPSSRLSHFVIANRVD